MARAALPKLPKQLKLPSGAVVQLRLADDASTLPPLEREPGAPLFDEVLQALGARADRRVTVMRNGAPIDVEELALRDFHVLRAVIARSGIVAESEIIVSCRNCGAPMNVRPCAALEIGPWVDGEANDPELDTTLPFGSAIDVPLIAMGRVRTGRTVTFRDRTVREALLLFSAAARERLEVTAELVSAMGIAALGSERNERKIAEALARCDDAAFFAVGNSFLASHYVARLGCIVFCEACRARNDIDAPYERESGGGEGEGDRPSAREVGPRDEAIESEGIEDSPLPDFEAFAARAREIAHPLLASVPGDEVELVIEGGTPDVDDGGEPLLGSYLPPHAGYGDAGMPTRAGCVTVYYRTFRAMWDEDGPYDWDEELHETIEHELEHHIAFLRGDDPMDDEERAEIAGEAVRIVGRREANRRAMVGFGASWGDFWRRTWPLWIIALLALAFTLITQR